MPIISIMSTFLDKIAGSIIWKLIERYIIKKEIFFLAWGLVSAKRNYYNRLKKLIRKMPFIYQNLDSSVIEDFQRMDIYQIELKRIDSFYHSKKVRLKDNGLNKLNDAEKVLIIGDAGVGKSTMMRHITLCMIDKKKSIHFTFQKHQIPLFIQLKALPAVKSPIINYIFDTIPIFKKNKIQTLVTLIKSRSIVFILDGYDEIIFIGNDRLINYELSLMFAGPLISSDIDKNKIDSDFIVIYKEIFANKVFGYITFLQLKEHNVQLFLPYCIP